MTDTKPAWPNGPTFRPAPAAFSQAISAGRLTTDSRSPRYAGDYMYMGTVNGRDTFKNRNTREYLATDAPRAEPTVIVQGQRVALGTGEDR